jgi:diacylglycerol kinase family enzyme
MNVVLIYNVKSGGEYGLRDLKALLKEHGVTVSYSFSVDQLGSKKLADLIERGVDVAAVGGDGTQNTVARLLLHTESRLLPLPGGTFNQFIRDIGASTDIKDTLKNISSAKERHIDVAFVNDELFLNNSNLGMYPFSLIEHKKIKKVIGKWPAAVLSIGKQFGRYRRHNLVIDSQPIKSPFVFIGNGSYDFSTLVPARTSIAKGSLTVMVSLSRTRADLMRTIMAVVRGAVAHRDDFTVTNRKSLVIYSRHAHIPVSLDGEVKRIVPPLHYRIEPKSLRVLVVKAT